MEVEAPPRNSQGLTLRSKSFRELVPVFLYRFEKCGLLHFLGLLWRLSTVKTRRGIKQSGLGLVWPRSPISAVVPLSHVPLFSCQIRERSLPWGATVDTGELRFGSGGPFRSNSGGSPCTPHSFSSSPQTSPDSTGVVVVDRALLRLESLLDLPVKRTCN